MITVNELEHVERPEGTLLLQTLRSHDQYNTTIYSLNDRYRGIKKGRHVVFVNPLDLADLGLTDGQLVDVTTVWTRRRRAGAARLARRRVPDGARLRGRVLPRGERARARSTAPRRAATRPCRRRSPSP